MYELNIIICSISENVKREIDTVLKSNKYIITRREYSNLKHVYVLLSAFQDGDEIIPVQINIKEFKKNQNSKLYMAVTLKKIRADIMGALPSKNPENAPPLALKINIADLIANVNKSEGEFVRLSMMGDTFLKNGLGS